EKEFLAEFEIGRAGCFKLGESRYRLIARTEIGCTRQHGAYALARVENVVRAVKAQRGRYAEKLRADPPVQILCFGDLEGNAECSRPSLCKRTFKRNTGLDPVFGVGVAFLMGDFGAGEKALAGAKEIGLAEIRRRRLFNLRNTKAQCEHFRSPEEVTMLPASADTSPFAGGPFRAKPHRAGCTFGNFYPLRQRIAFRRGGGDGNAGEKPCSAKRIDSVIHFAAVIDRALL